MKLDARGLEVLDDPNQLVSVIPLPLGELQKVPRSRQDSSSFCCGAGDCYAPSSPELQQAFVAQQSQGSKDGVRVHAEDCREVYCWRQPFSRLRFTVGDCTANLTGDLLIEGKPLDFGAQLDL